MASGVEMCQNLRTYRWPKCACVRVRACEPHAVPLAQCDLVRLRYVTWVRTACGFVELQMEFGELM